MCHPHWTYTCEPKSRTLWMNMFSRAKNYSIEREGIDNFRRYFALFREKKSNQIRSYAVSYYFHFHWIQLNVWWILVCESQNRYKRTTVCNWSDLNRCELMKWRQHRSNVLDGLFASSMSLVASGQSTTNADFIFDGNMPSLCKRMCTFSTCVLI